MKTLIPLFLLLIFGAKALAHPVAYQGATGVMTWNQPFMSDHWITYSFRPDMAVAGRFIRMERYDGSNQYYNGIQFDYLVKRWNKRNSQANVYAYISGGEVRLQKNSGGAYLAGIEADAESRKYFSLIKLETLQPSIGKPFNHVEGRLGIAPYEAEYEELASWFMVQAQWHPDLEKELVLTPLARFFYKSVLWETGVSLDGDWMLNLMFHF